MLYSCLVDTLALYVEQLFFSVSIEFRLLIVFFSSFAEGLPVIGSILPGGTIALLVGTLAQDGFIPVWIAIFIIGIGGFLGDSLGYAIGRRYKHARWLRKLVSQEKHQTAWDVFDRHIALIIIFGKLIPVVRSTPSIFAGARNIRVKKYFFFSFIGSFLWAFAGVFGGALIARVFGGSSVLVIIGLLALTGIIAFTSNYRKKRMRNRTVPE